MNNVNHKVLSSKITVNLNGINYTFKINKKNHYTSPCLGTPPRDETRGKGGIFHKKHLAKMIASCWAPLLEYNENSMIFLDTTRP